MTKILFISSYLVILQWLLKLSSLDSNEIINFFFNLKKSCKQEQK